MRKLGATAGLAPAAMALGLAAVFGSAGFMSDGSLIDLAIGSVSIIAFAVTIGWLVKPPIDGSVKDDVAAGVSYVITACLVYLVIVTIGSVSNEVAVGTLRDPFEVVVAIAFRFVYGLLYTPLIALVVAPFAIAWAITLRLLRRFLVPSRGPWGAEQP